MVCVSCVIIVTMQLLEKLLSSNGDADARYQGSSLDNVFALLLEMVEILSTQHTIIVNSESTLICDVLSCMLFNHRFIELTCTFFSLFVMVINASEINWFGRSKLKDLLLMVVQFWSTV